MAPTIDLVADAEQRYLGKSALCQLLGWSRPTLDLRLETDPRFPVLRRGVRGGGWSFDASAVLAYLSGVHPTQPIGTFTGSREASSTGDQAATKVTHLGEQTARQRRDAVHAEILENKLRRDRGDLVATEDMRKALAILQVHINKGLDGLCEQIVKLPGMSEADRLVRELVNDLRDMMAADLRSLLE